MAIFSASRLIVARARLALSAPTGYFAPVAILPQVAIFLLQIFSFSYLISMFIRQCSGLFNVQQTLVSVNANAIQNGIRPQWLSLARLFSRLISMSVPRATRGGDQAHAHNMLMRARLIGRERKNPPPVTIPNIILVDYVFGRRKEQEDIFWKRSEVTVLFFFFFQLYAA